MVWTNRITEELSSLWPVAMADWPPAVPEWPSAKARPHRSDCFSPPPGPLPEIAEGDSIRIVTGVFRGIEGTVLARRDAGRLVIAVELLEPGVTIEVDAAWVQSLGARGRLGFGR